MGATGEDPWWRWWLVVLYAVGMAWVEASVVYYLRTIQGCMNPYQPRPLGLADGLARAEVVRELATLVMLGAVGGLAGRTWRSRLGYALVAFGVWDIFYYVFLRPLTGWPQGLLDWDILFLIPLPWWGPVLAPACIAGLMILGGTMLGRHDSSERILRPRRRTVGLCVAGVTLALYVFMSDALRVFPQGLQALSAMLPTRFNWPLFLLALSLMATPVIDMGWRLRTCRDPRVSK